MKGKDNNFKGSKTGKRRREKAKKIWERYRKETEAEGSKWCGVGDMRRLIG